MTFEKESETKCGLRDKEFCYPLVMPAMRTGRESGDEAVSFLLLFGHSHSALSD